MITKPIPPLLEPSAPADYGEVLLTQHEALQSKVELIEIKLKLLSAQVNLYRAPGGGWND
ncbi:MAG TPA: hypothetical protein VIK71_09410 [Flavobacteriales bacterium]